MKTIMLILGVLAIAIGLLWIGQGTGYVQWPESSFMINQKQWSYYGAGVFLVGLLAIWYSRRKQ